MRGRLVEATKGRWGKLNLLTSQVAQAFGKAKASGMGGVYYDMEAFYASVATYMGDSYIYVYNTFKSDIKPRRFQRFNAGVKITEEQMLQKADNESLAAQIENAAEKQTRGLKARLDNAVIGFNSEVKLLSVLHKQAIAGSDINDPADCNATPGTAAVLTAVKWSGASKTEQNISTAIGHCIRLIQSKAIDTTTGESILKMDGSDTFDLWVHPNFAHILMTENDLLDTGETDPLTYAKRLAQDWAVTIRPTIAVSDGSVASTEQDEFVLTANTKENFKVVDVEPEMWTAWKDIDDGEVICAVKRYKAAKGAVAVPYLTSAGQAYKAMVTGNTIPYNA